MLFSCCLQGFLRVLLLFKESAKMLWCFGMVSCCRFCFEYVQTQDRSCRFLRCATCQSSVDVYSAKDKLCTSVDLDSTVEEQHCFQNMLEKDKLQLAIGHLC